MDDISNIKSTAHESLDVFSEIEGSASASLGHQASDGAQSLAYQQSFTNGKAVQVISDSATQNRVSYQHLQKEPAISRVKVLDDNDKEDIYYFCRTTPIGLKGNQKLAGYRSPIGKIAAAYVGDEVTVEIAGRIRTFEIIEKVSFTPVNKERWDSINTVFELDEDSVPKTVNSLRDLLGTGGEKEVDDILAQLLAEDESSTFVVEGIRREALKSMSLRDKPVLDKFQDEIFRLPIDSQLLIVGPPGTGKTTTLIRRLGQKLDRFALSEQETNLIEKNDLNSNSLHETSWLMFTPTELLKQYVKEAFNREEIPASNEKIQTWDNYRKYIARNVLGLLKSASSNGRFVLKEKEGFISDSVIAEPLKWFSDFSNYHDQRIIDDVKTSLTDLEKLGEAELSSVLGKLKSALAKSSTPVNMCSDLFNIEGEVTPLLIKYKEIADTGIRKTLNLLLNTQGKTFLAEFASFIDSLKHDLTDDEEDEASIEDEEESDSPKTSMQQAIGQYNRFIRSLAHNSYKKRKFGKSSKNNQIQLWLDKRLPTESILSEIGYNIVLQNSLRKFVNMSKRYVYDIPASYRNFRKTQKDNTDLYRSIPSKVNELSPFELDAIILKKLLSSRELIEQKFVKSNLELAKFSNIHTIISLYRTQILVDEATDFSPIQLACMFNLTTPKTNSFFACGDFNQRITKWGCQTEEQIQWISNGINIKAINTVYRQSKLLNDFANGLISVMDNARDVIIELPKHVIHDGFSPALIENVDTNENIAKWIYDRIIEVERNVGELPTIAVLVNDESLVQGLATQLDELLQEENSLNVVACLEGKVIGEENDVRVFSVEHIKGLEFEAVFFVGIDKLASVLPDLFDKYLYVGTTRAATYLGMTAEKAIPSKLESLRDKFVDSWQV